MRSGRSAYPSRLAHASWSNAQITGRGSLMTRRIRSNSTVSASHRWCSSSRTLHLPGAYRRSNAGSLRPKCCTVSAFVCSSCSISVMDSPQASNPTQTTALSTASFCWRCDARELGRVPDPQFTNLSSPVHVRGSAGGLSQRFIGHGQGPVGGSVLRPRPQYSKPLSGTLHGSPSASSSVLP